MRVLQISNYFFPHIGGIEQVAKDITLSLKNNSDIEQLVICFNEEQNINKSIFSKTEDKIDVFDNIKIYRCGCIGKFFSQSISITYYKNLRNIFLSFNPDIVIFHYPNPFVAFFLLRLIENKTKLILYWHLDITKQKLLRLFFRSQTLKLMKRANIIVATSPNYIDGSKFLRLFQNKCVVIPNCVNIKLDNIDSIEEKVRNIKKKYNNKFLCFAIGRHIPYKGYEYLIKSSKELDNNYKILIGGVGPLTSKLKRMSKYSKNIDFLGRLANDDLIAFYKACDLVLFPSITKNEAFGISLAEGMSFGKPAITYSIKGSGVNYVSINGFTGIECKNRDYKEFAKAIEKMRSNSKLRLQYGENAKNRVNSHFTYEIFCKKINDLIRL